MVVAALCVVMGGLLSMSLLVISCYVYSDGHCDAGVERGLRDGVVFEGLAKNRRQVG